MVQLLLNIKHNSEVYKLVVILLKVIFHLKNKNYMKTPKIKKYKKELSVESTQQTIDCVFSQKKSYFEPKRVEIVGRFDEKMRNSCLMWTHLKRENIVIKSFSILNQKPTEQQKVNTR